MIKCTVSVSLFWLLGSVVLSLCCVFYFGHEAVSLSLVPSSLQTKSGQSKDAYVTLLYSGGPFLLGARVLGQSLRETGTTKALIALCTNGVSEDDRRLLIADGWQVRSVHNIKNPYEGKTRSGDYFSGAYSKLHIWNMTEYERIVFLDSDVIVLSNIDHIFDCGTLCLVYRHSDLFNSGVLVVEPSTKVFNDLIENVPLIPSYENGEQGFLNIYFKDLRYAKMFNWSDSKRQHEPMRLQAGLNADTAMYYLKSEWLIPDDELKVIHYTIGPVSKPWVWWTPYLLDLNWHWNTVRNRLPRHKEFDDPYEVVLRWMVLSLPYPLLAIFFTLLSHLDSSRDKICAMTTRMSFTLVNKRLCYVFPLVFVFVSYYLAYHYVVPTTMLPHQAAYVFWLWSHNFVVVFFGSYCCLCHVASPHSQLCLSQKKTKTLMLYAVYLASYALLQVVPPSIGHFLSRMVAFGFVLAVHIVVCQITGQWVIRVWSGPEN